MSEYMDKYKEELYDLINNASQDELRICIAWDKDFGIPVYGGTDYVRTQLTKAKQAIAALKYETSK